MLRNFPVILAAGLLIGLVVRLLGSFATDPVFYWRGSRAPLPVAVSGLLI
jgi:hypothetical protein